MTSLVATPRRRTTGRSTGRVAALVVLAAVAVTASPVAPVTMARAAPVAIGAPARYVAVGPERLADTREAECGCARTSGGTVRVQVTGRFGIAPGATAAAVTITATGAATSTYVTAWPAGTDRPTTSTVNVRPMAAVANAAIVALSDDGAIELFSPAPVDLVVDVAGVFEPVATTTSGRFVATEPVRLLDTRTDRPRLEAGGDVAVPMPAGVPSDALALVVNVTSVDAAAAGFVTARAGGAAMPATSMLNPDGSGAPVAAAAIVPASASGIAISTSSASHLVVDLVGWFTGPSAPMSADGLFVAATPERLLDTRSSAPRLWRDGTRELAVDVPGAAAVVTNVTLDLADGAGFVTASAAGTPRPATSTVNARGRDVIVANAAITGLSDRGLAWYANAGTDLIVDITGWFTGAPQVATEPEAPNAMPAPPRVLLIGDSTLAALDVVTASQQALQGMVADLDAAPCRRLVRPSCRSAFTGGVPATGVEAILRAPGPIDVVVVKAGYNEGSSGFDASVVAVLAAARQRGAHTVVWLTYSEGTGNQLRTYELNNAVLHRLRDGGAWPELVVAEWRTYAASSSGWYSADRVHLQGTGAWATADYVSRWVAHATRRSCPQPWAPGGSIDARCPNPDVTAAAAGPPALRALYGF